jgi:hypothetical protein
MAIDVDKTYRPSRGTRVMVVVFVLPGTLLLAWMGASMLFRGQIAGVAFIALAIGCCLYAAFLLTCRVTLKSDAVARTWLWGTCAIPMANVARLDRTSARGQKWLVIRAGKNRMSISATAVGDGALTEIERYILAARGLDGQTRLPRYADWVDIDAMLKQLRAADEDGRASLKPD